MAGFTIEVKGNIRADEELKVTVPASIAITAENDAGYTNTATVAIDTSVFGRDVINNDTYTVVNGSVAFNETKADTYKGNVNFKVALEQTIKMVSFKYEFYNLIGDYTTEDRTVVEGTTVGEAFDCSKLFESNIGNCMTSESVGPDTGMSYTYIIWYVDNGVLIYPESTDTIKEGVLYVHKKTPDSGGGK